MFTTFRPALARVRFSAAMVCAASLGLALVACFDDDPASSGGGTTGADASSDASLDQGASPPPDGGAPADAAGMADATDAGDATAPFEIITAFGPAGVINVEKDFVFAEFREDQLIVRSPSVPECVFHLGSAVKRKSPAGTFDLGGDTVGTDGGPPEAVVVPFDNASRDYYDMPQGLLYFAEEASKVQIALAGTPYVPGLAPTTVRGPAFAKITVTSPTTKDVGGEQTLVIDASKPLPLAWSVTDAPRAASTAQKLIFSLFALTAGPRLGELRCGFPLEKGSATIPSELLLDLKTRLGPLEYGFAQIRAGGQTEVTANGASYVIQVADPDGTTFSEGDPPLLIE